MFNLKSFIAWFVTVALVGGFTVAILEMFQPPLSIWFCVVGLLGYVAKEIEIFFDKLFSEKSDKES